MGEEPSGACQARTGFIEALQDGSFAGRRSGEGDNQAYKVAKHSSDQKSGELLGKRGLERTDRKTVVTSKSLSQLAPKVP